MPRQAKRKASGPAETGRTSSKRRLQGSSTGEPSQAADSEDDSKPAKKTLRRRPAARNLLPLHEKQHSASFGNLPEEIILEILDFFVETIYCTAQIRALYNLTLTSRQLYRLSKPYLYSYVDNRLVEPRKLLRTLIQEPQMTGRVRNLQWYDDHGNLITCWKRKDKKYALTHIERRELCKKVEELGLINPRMYSRGFQMQRPKDHLAAMLLLCPNIRTLDVCDTNVCCYPRGYHAAPSWIRMLGEVGFGDTKVLSQHFQHLSVIRIRLGPIRLLHIPPILNIRSLRSLMLEDVYQPDTINKWMWDFAVSPRTSPLKNLYVENSYIDSKSLAQMIGSVKALRLFCFDFDNSVRNGAYTLYDDDIPELHYPTIATALLEHKDSLEQLSICDNAYPELNEIFDIDAGSLGSLRTLHKVRVLDIDIDCFGGIDVDYDDIAGTLDTTIRPAMLADNLPSSLEQLDINLTEDDSSDYEVFWFRSLEMLASSMKTRLPALKEVGVSRKGLGEVETGDHLVRLQERYAKEGVKLSIAKGSWWDSDVGYGSEMMLS
jgi:hypothetical protein